MTSTQLIKYFIAAVWLANGLFCKVLSLVPRHQEIVGSILDTDHAAQLTTAIGFSEILMAIWVSLLKPFETTTHFLLSILWIYFSAVFYITFCN